MSNTLQIIALEGGGTRCQALQIDLHGNVHGSHIAGPVNTNFVSFEKAQEAVLEAIRGALQASGSPGKDIDILVSALVGPRFGPELLGELLPNAEYRYAGERDVVYARGGVYEPHGVAVVAATGATAWAVRKDDGRTAYLGGWGALLGDEGSAYSVGLLALRAAAKACEGRLDLPTHLVEAVADHFQLNLEQFKLELVRLAYQKPLNRTDIAGLAPAVTRLAGSGDLAAERIVRKVVSDLTSLAQHGARRLFKPEESFEIVVAGGLFNAGEMVLQPLRQGLLAEFPQSVLRLGDENPALALGKMTIHDLKKKITRMPRIYE
jgi:N-acetylglucosamine kinase-like BadF-type ATPase